MPNKSPGKKSPLTPGVPVLRAHRFARRMRRNDIRISLLVERLEQRIEFKGIDQSDELGRKLSRVVCAALRVGTDTRARRPVKSVDPARNGRDVRRWIVRAVDQIPAELRTTLIMNDGQLLRPSSIVRLTNFF